ncbi:hypothetical protein PT974_12450 [Cladobotryum mycophilum]|uniref:Heterokaryon incompatibility domain-containing protein n=1 Tax=Cladobotryum mycophilum TaxID=491253 RepID=A0ABR0S854_9HYPO
MPFSKRFMAPTEEAVPRTVFNHLLSQIEHTIDISSQATPCRLRFIDCEAFVKDSVLKIYEAFNVAGAEDADPISIDVLRTACLASITFQSRLLWLDRLCILQKDKNDKSWQIKKMFGIYKNAHPCLVLPGGLSRLATLFDQTTWIHRSWTLQESVAPTMAICLFAWTLGPATSFRFSLGHIFQLEKGLSAMAHLIGLLNLSLVSTVTDEHPAKVYLSIRIFGHDTSLNEKMHVALLVQALSSDGDLRENAVWRSSFLRTSSRAVDAVISIMGLFGVELNPSDYAEDERLQPTIDLMRKILRNGGRANWLTLSERAKMSYEFCLAPKFPETSVNREAFYRTPRALPLPKLKSAPSIRDFPNGLDSSAPEMELFRDYDMVDRLYEGIARPHRHDDDSANTYAIWIATKKPFPASGMNAISLHMPIFMLVHRPTKNDRFFCVGLTTVRDGFVAEQHFVEREFTVGGFQLGKVDEGEIAYSWDSE